MTFTAIKRLIYRLLTVNDASLQWRDCLTAMGQGRACAVAKVGNFLRCRARCWWAVIRGKTIFPEMYIEVCSLCQNQCANCLHSGAIQAQPGYQLSLEQLSAWIDATQRSGYFFREVWMNGPGEPLLWKHLDAGLQTLRDSGVAGAIIVVSNGQAMGRIDRAAWRNIDLMHYDVYPGDCGHIGLPEARIYRLPVSKLFVILMFPYSRKRFSEEVAETHLLDPVFLPAEDSFKRRRKRGIEIDAGRNLPIGRDIKVPKWVLLTHGYVDSR
jgi:hypothetical protein